MKVKLLSHVWLCDFMDCSPPGFSVHGILQARILEWVTISFSRGSSWLRDQIRVSCIADRFFTTDHQGSRTTQAATFLWEHFNKAHLLVHIIVSRSLTHSTNIYWPIAGCQALCWVQGILRWRKHLLPTLQGLTWNLTSVSFQRERKQMWQNVSNWWI